MIRFDWTIAGIPCQVEETSAWDRGWHLVDPRGRAAAWLERKITQVDILAIERRIEIERDDLRVDGD